MEDVRIGRKSIGSYWPGVATTTPVEAIPANPHRTGLYLSGPGAGGGTAVFLTLSPIITAAGGQGLTTTNFGNGVSFTIEELGDMITKAWYIQVNTGTAGYCIIEKSLGDE
jgi:hypothetical protein